MPGLPHLFLVRSPDAKSLAAAVSSAAVMAPDAPSYRYAAERQVVGKLVMSVEVMQQVAAMLFQDMPDKTVDEPRRMAAH